MLVIYYVTYHVCHYCNDVVLDLIEGFDVVNISKLLPGFTSFSELNARGPNIIVAGDATRVINSEGRPFLDAVSGLWNHCLGFTNSEITAAMSRASSELSGYHLMQPGGCESTYELANELSGSVASLVEIRGRRNLRVT